MHKLVPAAMLALTELLRAPMSHSASRPCYSFSRLDDHYASIQHAYREQGYVVIEDVFDSDDMDAVVTQAMELSAADMKLSNDDDTASNSNQPGEASKAGYLVDCDPTGNLAPAPRKIDGCFLKSQQFRQVAMSEKLRLVVATVMDAAATQDRMPAERPEATQPLLFADQAFMKPPRVGSAKPYHQDNFYFKCDPVDEVVTCWIALDDATEENGCLRYIEGSHLGGQLMHSPVQGDPHNLVPAGNQIDMSSEMQAPVRKGGVILHHGHTLHCSGENRSSRWRRSYATHWISQRVSSTSATTLASPIFKSAEWR